jgi:glucose-1-phosphate adenylyltransferase
MHRTMAIVLAGGEGRRLQPLTRERSKPAVYFGGRYRLIDFVLSNLVNSGITSIKVVTQYRSTSLVQHLARAWPTMSNAFDHSIDTVPAAMNLGPSWFRGTADAIWQNLDLLREQRPENLLIFGSDHVYKMDVGRMLDAHRDTGADLTVAVLPVPRSEAHAFGCVAVDDTGRITDFLEKPKDPPAMPGHPDLTLVSMGNYAFRSRALLEELRRCMNQQATSYDFGKDILATAHQRMEVRAYDFKTHLCPGEDEHARGYWRDVGTLDAYYEASMDLVSIHPHLDLYNEQWPIRGAQPLCGPAKFVFSDEAQGRVGTARDSIVGAGSIISGASLSRSVCFHQVKMHSYSRVEDSVLFPHVDVGRGARLKRCIIDKGVHIPPNTVIGEDPAADRARFGVSDGGVVVVSRADFGQYDEYDVSWPSSALRSVGIAAE